MSPPRDEPRAALGDIEALVLDLRPLAERLLREQRSFLPFGGHMKSNGQIVRESVGPEGEVLDSRESVEILRQSHRDLARAGGLRACATIYDSLVVPPNESHKRDAIAAELDHRDGYAGIVYFPYRFTVQGELYFDPPFAVRGEGRIFEAAER